MTIKHKLIKNSSFILLFHFFSLASYSQSLAINTTGESATQNAMLDIKSLNKGILIPRVNLADTSNPIGGFKPEGLLVWNDSAGYDKGKGFYFWTGSKWHPVTMIYKAGTNVTIDSASNTINAFVQINTVILDGIVPAPTSSNRYATYNTDFNGNPAWRRENLTTYYIEKF